jgi:hypothetical protein
MSLTNVASNIDIHHPVWSATAAATAIDILDIPSSFLKRDHYRRHRHPVLLHRGLSPPPPSTPGPPASTTTAAIDTRSSCTIGSSRIRDTEPLLCYGLGQGCDVILGLQIVADLADLLLYFSLF